MPRLERRRFTLADLMVLIAVVAVSIPLMRWIKFEPKLPIGTGSISPSPSNWIYWFWSGEPSCVVATTMLALIPLRWLGSRPSASRIVRQPGAVACLAGAGAMIVGLANCLISEAIFSNSDAPGVLGPAVQLNSWYWREALGSIPLAILGVWTALAMSGRWSPEASWIDRAGRAMGIFWVVLYPLGYFNQLFRYWLPYKS
jgi:hypothetical protein